MNSCKNSHLQRPRTEIETLKPNKDIYFFDFFQKWLHLQNPIVESKSYTTSDITQNCNV